nr:hypothetical protein [Lacrimispora sp.]
MFSKTFSTGSTEIAPFAKDQSDGFSLKNDIINFLDSIVMNSFCFAAIARTDLLRGFGFNKNS